MATRAGLVAIVTAALAASIPASRGVAASPAEEPSVSATALAAPLPGAFVALWMPPPDRGLELQQFSASDGRPLGRAASLPQWPTSVSVPYRAGDDALWLTLTSGPRYRSGVLGGDPAPNSCTGEIVRIDAQTLRSEIVYHAPASVLIDNAVPSPDGRRVAFQAGGCETSYFNQHLVVRDLRTGAQTRIGAHAPRCHYLSPGAWSPDGRRLVFAFGPAAPGRPSHPLPLGACTAPLASELALARPDRSARIVKQMLTPAARSCGYREAAFNRSGIVAIETCGPNGLGAAYLVQLDRTLKRVRRLPLAPGADPATLAVDRHSGRVIVSEYQVPQYQASGQNANYVWIYGRRGLRLVASYGGLDGGDPIGATW
jgi:hypothetical protein